MTLPSTEPPAVVLDWDSEFWGVRIGRTTPASISAEPDGVREWVRDHDVRCLYLRCPVDDGLVEVAEDFGFQLMESRAEYEQTSPVPFPTPMPCVVRAVLPSDIDALTRIARVSHHDSRFFTDPRFADERCGDLFATWIVNSCTRGFAEWVLVAEVDGVPCGYVTGQHDDDGWGRVGLIAVDESLRGRGVGQALLAASVSRHRREGRTDTRVTTQARNPATRFYRRLGFVESGLSLDLHWWCDDDYGRSGP